MITGKIYTKFDQTRAIEDFRKQGITPDEFEHGNMVQCGTCRTIIPCLGGKTLNGSRMWLKGQKDWRETKRAGWVCDDCRAKFIFPPRKVHTVKSHPEAFQAVVKGLKPFEIRVNDRGYEVGDVVCMQEWNPDTKKYTREQKFVLITYLVAGGNWGLPSTLCVFAFKSWFDLLADNYMDASDTQKASIYEIRNEAIGAVQNAKR